MCNTGWATNTYREVWAPFGHFINVVFPALNKFVWQVTWILTHWIIAAQANNLKTCTVVHPSMPTVPTSSSGTWWMRWAQCASYAHWCQWSERNILSPLSMESQGILSSLIDASNEGWGASKADRVDWDCYWALRRSLSSYISPFLWPLDGTTICRLLPYIYTFV